MGCAREAVTGYKLKIVDFLCRKLQESCDRQAAIEYLQRLINALEGPTGPDFKVGPKVGNPCHGMPGDGILVDLTNPEFKRIYGEEAVDEAFKMAELARIAVVQGIAKPGASLEEIKRAARIACTFLHAVMEAIDL